MKTLVLGLGNPLLTDDAAGIRVARRLRDRLAGRTEIEVDEDYWGGLRLMERMIGYDRCIVIDAMCTGAEPGTLQRLDVRAAATQHSSSAHDASLFTALSLGRRLGAELPPEREIVVFGIEAEDVHTFGEQCTPRVESALPRVVDAVLAALDRSQGRTQHRSTQGEVA